jgi:hypothetical protein
MAEDVCTIKMKMLVIGDPTSYVGCIVHYWVELWVHTPLAPSHTVSFLCTAA